MFLFFHVFSIYNALKVLRLPNSSHGVAPWSWYARLKGATPLHPSRWCHVPLFVGHKSPIKCTYIILTLRPHYILFRSHQTLDLWFGYTLYHHFYILIISVVYPHFPCCILIISLSYPYHILILCLSYPYYILILSLLYPYFLSLSYPYHILIISLSYPYHIPFFPYSIPMI